MLYPVLPDNLKAYKRLGRRKLVTVVAVPLAAALAMVAVIALHDALRLSSDAADRLLAILLFAILGAGFLHIGYCTIMQLVIFRRDLRSHHRKAGDG
jgi:heme/copper-type cytochrome/quinol oxidase subunit 3